MSFQSAEPSLVALADFLVLRLVEVRLDLLPLDASAVIDSGNRLVSPLVERLLPVLARLPRYVASSSRGME